MRKELEESYGYLFEKELIDEIVEVGSMHEASRGETIIEHGQNLRSMPLILEGAIKISRKDNDGDELALYYLERGDSCTMTMSCCMGNRRSVVKALAETDVKYISVPIGKMKEWMKKYPTWMAFVFQSYDSRFNELLEAIDSLAFTNMGDRVFKYLKDQVIIRKSTVLDISHQDIAYDLHTSRVVISRLLKSLENEGLIELGRNKIMVIEF
ncbi:MAG: Crp/Fnr family transcriptional regulator [Flavobacteriales bacterium]|nr:Crp/Fnr family transcriptional regulator [Flavobacteriales bacterium]